MRTTETHDRWTAFALECVTEAMGKINELGGRGRDVVAASREGDYRYWDPETLRVDKVAEEIMLQKLRDYRLTATLLSEEIRRVQVDSGVEPEESVFIVADPFDGSWLYKRRIPAFWYTSLAVYGSDMQARCAVIGDCIEREITYADGSGAYRIQAWDGQWEEPTEIEPASTADLSSAFIESYLMKPHFMYPAVLDFAGLFKKVKFIVPNGGPAGFADVAQGKVDIYLAIRQPFVEVFSGVAIAERAGAVVTTFDGLPLLFEDDIDQRYNVVCSANTTLHEQVLEEIRKIQV